MIKATIKAWINILLNWKRIRMILTMFLFKVPLIQEVTEVIEVTEKTKFKKSNQKLKFKMIKHRNLKKKNLPQEEEEVTECQTI